jgi:hypothetical protein
MELLRFLEGVLGRMRYATKVGVGDNDGCDADEVFNARDSIV